MRKLSESVWGDIRKKSLGIEDRIEGSTNIKDMKPVDLGGSVLWADRDLAQEGKETFTYDEVKELLSGTEWRLPTREEAKELDRPGKYESYGWSFSEGDQKLEFRKRKYTDKDPGNTYVGWTSDIAIESANYIRLYVFVFEDSPSNEGIINIGDEMSHYSVRLVKDLK